MAFGSTVPGAPPTSLPGTSASGKTKAKQRYLKRKKERRKQKKTKNSGGSKDEDEAVESELEQKIGSEEEHTDDEDGERVESTITSKRRKTKKLETVTLASGENETGVRPRKRMKLNSELLGEDADDNDNKSSSKEPASETSAESGDAEESQDVIKKDSTTTKARSPLQPLPSFPLPTRPDAPSNFDLALQGLDKALIRATILDPTATTSVDPDEADSQTTILSTKMRRRLRDLGINELFSVQSALVSFLLPASRTLRSLYSPYQTLCDACVSAPTGSGKTLAYVVPIIELLSARIVTRLRALVILPTRDLVSQAQETFEAIGKGRGLKIGTATGQHSFAHEQSQLVPERQRILQGGSSAVDILICTPGRLIDHLNGTPNFSLQHLRFLVIDEADRLLAQSFQDWLAQVLAATRPPISPVTLSSDKSTICSSANVNDFLIPYHDAMAPAWVAPDIQTTLEDESRTPSCQKLLFSATLTNDPGKLKALDLHAPQYFIVRSSDDSNDGFLTSLAIEKFAMPPTLSEHFVVCESANKPLALFQLVRAHGVRSSALVFTKSTEAAARLAQLFDLFFNAPNLRKVNDMDVDGQMPKPIIRAYSSDLPAGERKNVLKQFKEQKIDILICSDLVSRGIDVPHVEHVISYDVPVDMRKYVHRAGRTARAGRTGDAWTLVEEQEVWHFKEMLKAAGHTERVKRLRISKKDLSLLMPAYEHALEKMKEKYART